MPFVYEVSIVYEVSECLPGIFDIWIPIAPNIFQKVRKIGPGVPQGTPKSVQGVPPQRLRNKNRKTTRHTWKVPSNCLPNGSQHLKVWCILGNIFKCFFHICFWFCCQLFFDSFGIIFSIMCYNLPVFFYIILKLADLCKCTPLQYRSMCFEISAPRSLVILS